MRVGGAERERRGPGGSVELVGGGVPVSRARSGQPSCGPSASALAAGTASGTADARAAGQEGEESERRTEIQHASFIAQECVCCLLKSLRV